MEKFLNDLKLNVDFRIMHSFDKINDNKSDIDIIIQDNDISKLTKIINILCDNYNLSITSNYYGIVNNLIFNIIDLKRLKSYRLDFYFEAYISSYKTYPYAFKSIDKNLFFNSNNQNNIINSSPEVEFSHYLLRKNIKNDLNNFTLDKLETLYKHSDKNVLKEILNPVLENHLTNKIINGDFDINSNKELQNHLVKRKHFVKLNLRKRLFTSLRNFNLKKGIHVAIIGPDGTGKTTLIEGIKEFVEPIFTDFKYIHLRPTFVPATSQIKKKINSNHKSEIPKPHANKEYSFIKDIFKTLIIYIDYLIGYQFNIKPYKRKNYFVCSDRYFYDILVDPKRFRVKKLSRITKSIFQYTLQKPDITILLQADPKTVFARKKDLTFEEITRQNSEYELLSKKFKEIQIVSSQDSIRQVLANSLQSIFQK